MILKIPSASAGKTLLLLGVSLVGAFIAGSRLVFTSVFPYAALGPIFGSNLLSLLALLVATVAAVVGTVALVRVPPPEHRGSNINDVAFFAVGLVASSIGIWLCTSIGLELLLVR
jgi:hypothetical protein